MLINSTNILNKKNDLKKKEEREERKDEDSNLWSLMFWKEHTCKSHIMLYGKEILSGSYESIFW